MPEKFLDTDSIFGRYPIRKEEVVLKSALDDLIKAHSNMAIPLFLFDRKKTKGHIVKAYNKLEKIGV